MIGLYRSKNLQYKQTVTRSFCDRLFFIKTHKVFNSFSYPVIKEKKNDLTQLVNTKFFLIALIWKKYCRRNSGRSNISPKRLILLND